MGQITVNQSHQVMATLVTNIDWRGIDFKETGLQDMVIRNPKEAGRQFAAFLKNGCRMGIIGAKIISIDRTVSFDLVKFLGERWTIEEQDERSLLLTQVDLAKVQFEHMLKFEESCISGEEKLKRLKEMGHIRLDAKVLQTLWNNQHLIPERWKEKTKDKTTCIFFDGSIFRNSSNCWRYVLLLSWQFGQWRWDYCRIDYNCYINHYSIVLAS